MNQQTRLTILASSLILLLAMLACNLPENIPVSLPIELIEQTETDDQRAETTAPAPLALIPISMQDGLASLDSFYLVWSLDMSGDLEERSRMDSSLAYSREQDARHMQITSFSADEDSPEGVTESTEQYQVGNELCFFDGETWAYQEMTDLQREVSDLVGSIPDMRFPIENPTLLGEEMVNGVLTNHVRFHLASLGSRSGADVQEAGGEYWLAKDGRYLVKYTLTINMRTGPQDDTEAQAVFVTAVYELRDINQPRTIPLPADCLAIQTEQP